MPAFVMFGVVSCSSVPVVSRLLSLRALQRRDEHRDGLCVGDPAQVRYFPDCFRSCLVSHGEPPRQTPSDGGSRMAMFTPSHSAYSWSLSIPAPGRRVPGPHHAGL